MAVPLSFKQTFRNLSNLRQKKKKKTFSGIEIMNGIQNIALEEGFQ